MFPSEQRYSFSDTQIGEYSDVALGPNVSEYFLRGLLGEQGWKEFQTELADKGACLLAEYGGPPLLTLYRLSKESFQEYADLARENEAAMRIWRRRADEADQKLLQLARLAYRRHPDGRTDHDSMSGGCDAYEPLFSYEGREPPGKCDCGADRINDKIDEILGPLKKEL